VRLHGPAAEIQVRGPNVFAGYWERPDANAGAFVDGGWFATGDIGEHDDAGYLRIVGRAKELIISGGENIHPTEIESVLMQHPAVAECAAFGVPDARWGEAVHAVVVPRPGHAVDAVSLMAFCRERIAGYKVPKQIDLRSDPLPKSGPGKVLKRELRAPFWAGHTAHIN